MLALAQIGVHLVFFLHLGSGPNDTNNILALAFGVLIVFLVIAGSIWIIANLNANTMPTSHAFIGVAMMRQLELNDPWERRLRT